MDFDQAILDADTTLIIYAGKSVIYRRGEYSCTWTAISGNTTFEMTDANGASTSFETADFIGLAEDLILDEEPSVGPIEPQRKDRIWKTVGDNILVYEVLNLSNAPCFKYSDPEHKIIRIHTKLIE